ncbi:MULTISPECIES: efflux transporter outer membrane subunit [Paraburkholderia]|jgi:NodT family efflux transporter outer membrane factor (OMF) lipoprotein|uniref:efflux transporter outer membrane subunit n=1 Tax=Paraburkholderia TaxID=1822464 RepID=UPI0009A8F821|nr:efflux transporter outer membrane subunit [Paraburkholderia hospita]SKC96704.1 efflux transporter, outer membrane factor (OMF) lipoprotein, NodT family [Burkholderia sp. CF099]SOE90107.1 efflux transporter, outer membrane factor (OMF) lipoprotein, NodT family [Burkholderia sp. YR290]AXF04872.1 RND transporter [Paraburkholderia hospita]OUL92286.1 RND transporter [Paraburkholderia hospita]SKC96854.1 efflux transporter, outer membrane factor (OMF) lipoprotein, NodT family [Paraburkholderia hos
MFNVRASLVRKSVVIAVASALTACSTLPHYSQPQTAVPDHFASTPQASAGWTLASPADAQSRGPWWTLYGDDELNKLEAQVDVSNQTVAKAVAQLEAARAMVDYQRAGYAPTVTAGTSAQRFRTSQNIVHRGLAGHTVPDFSVGVAASWEPDLFGRVKDATVNARDNAQASEADLQSVRLAVAADLATDYFDLRSLDRQKKLLDDTVTAYAAALRILQQQLNDGAIDASAVAQAQTQLESTRTQDSDIDVQRAQLQHAIATLIGQPASSFSLSPKVETIALPQIPAGVPSQLLERRPDIAAAERRVAAANAQIGQARAAFYPNLTLSATAGLESTFFAPWLTASSLFWSLGSQIAGTLFDGGRRTAALKGANAQYDGTVADYRQTVLVAFQQVEDNLSSLDTLANEADSQQRATTAADLSLKLTSNRFQAGAVNYLDVVTAQTIALSNERTAEQIDARRIDASVRLLKALGGGWDRASLTDARATD